MDALVLPGLVTGAALLVAVALKVGRGDRLAATFEELRVPRPVAGPWARRTLPAAELVIGAAVVLLPAPVVVLPAFLATALLAAYAGLVGRVLARGETATCACFGGEETVGSATLARNLLLLLAAGLALADAVAGHSTLQRLTALGPSGWAWLAGVAAVAVLAALVAPPAHGPARGPARVEPDVRGIPFLVVHHPDGTPTSLPELAALRPQLLVTLSETCGACTRVAEALPGWRDRLPAVDLRVLAGTPTGAPAPATWGAVLHDPDRRVSTVLGLVHPSAVLLGADALVAAGPVHGATAVLDLLAEVEAALDAAG